MYTYCSYNTGIKFIYCKISNKALAKQKFLFFILSSYEYSEKSL